MKRLALIAAVFFVAACGKKEEAPADTMTPAAVADSANALIDNAADAADSTIKAAGDSLNKLTN